jgi:hypothetical protein
VRSLRNPERFNIVVGLCLALGASTSVRSVVDRLSRERAAGLCVALSILVLLEYWSWPFPTREPDVPEFYHQLAAEAGDFAVADVPISNDLSKRYMYYQTVHGKPIVAGHVSRPPEHAYDFILSSDLLRAMWEGGQEGLAGDVLTELGTLKRANVRYLIVHRDSLSEAELAALGARLSKPPLFSDDRLIVHEIASLP